VSSLFGQDDVEEEEDRSVVGLKKSLWERLTRIAKRETAALKAMGGKPKVISRNDVIRRMLEMAVDEYERAEKMPPLERPKRQR
jgi:hypothetical protein